MMKRFGFFIAGTSVCLVAMAALSTGVFLGSMGMDIHWTGFGHAHAQTINAGVATPKKGHVDFIAEGQSIAANKPATVKLHFRVDNGFHINSHTPKSDVLIATKLTVAMVGDDPEVTNVDFPAGEPFSFAFEPKQKLDVYQGDVILTAHLKAKPGPHTLKAELYYQACDQSACYPPKKLPFEQPYTAK